MTHRRKTITFPKKRRTSDVEVRRFTVRDSHLLPIEGIEPLTDFVPYSTESFEDKVFVSCKLRRVIETDVQAVGNLSKESGATFFRSSTHSDDIIPRLVEEFLNIAGRMIGNVYSGFCHHPHGKRMNASCRCRSCRTDLKTAIE